MIKLVIATRNKHKVEEISALLGRGFDVRTLGDFPHAPAVTEDASTFAGNATKKAVELARYIATIHGLGAESAFALADDSGLEVDALNGAPGVHSARFAADDAHTSGNTPDADNNAKLLRLLHEVPLNKRTARFRCVIALTPIVPIEPAGASPACAADERELQTELFDGACEGHIQFAATGARGFGYDPLFIPNGYTQSFAELGEEVKNRISHRAKALEKLHRWLARRA